MKLENLSCPLPFEDDVKIALAHGGGGRRMTKLIDEVILPHFPTGKVANNHDGAVLPGGTGDWAFTTDAYVVTPSVFPGGNIGDLAINGTVNDLAMTGAEPLYLSCAFILEEGYSMESFRQILVSMGAAARNAGVALVTGDTKVVDRGKGDGIFITTSGMGRMLPGANVHPTHVRPGDAVVLSGNIGDHGITIMSLRENLGLEGRLESDSRPLHGETRTLIEKYQQDIHCLRDVTRGGLASIINEIATDADVTIVLDEKMIPVNPAVKAACEILGLDPLYIANEGKFVAFVPEQIAAETVDLLRQAGSSAATLVGHVTKRSSAPALINGLLGSTRILDQLSGEQLPRIC